MEVWVAGQQRPRGVLFPLSRKVKAVHSRASHGIPAIPLGLVEQTPVRFYLQKVIAQTAGLQSAPSRTAHKRPSRTKLKVLDGGLSVTTTVK